jgi:hypothetical protein
MKKDRVVRSFLVILPLLLFYRVREIEVHSGRKYFGAWNVGVIGNYLMLGVDRLFPWSRSGE